MSLSEKMLQTAVQAGLDVSGQEAALLRLITTLGGRWIPVGEALPEDRRPVLVAYQTAGGPPGQTEAVFYVSNPNRLSQDELANFLEHVTEPELRESIVKDNEALPTEGCFGMGGGDWDAQFYAPHYSRKGWDYFERDEARRVTITHWRYPPPLPYEEEGGA